MLPIKLHLWFDNQAKEAAEFYTSLLPDSAITFSSQLQNTPSGNCDVVAFTIAGQPFMAISAGPTFKFNPSISLIINFDPSRDARAHKRIHEVWEKLADKGLVMMPLDEYPFSKCYGWVADKYGVSWQLMLTDPEGEPRPVILPSLMFTGDVAGRANQAIDFYCTIFKDSKRGTTVLREQDMGPDKSGTVLFADFYIDGTWIAVTDSAYGHGFAFNEAVSLLIDCENQGEIDALFTALSAEPSSEQCGWLKDKFGVCWQITSVIINNVLKNGSQSQIDKVTEAFLAMKKIDVDALDKAFDQTE